LKPIVIVGSYNTCLSIFVDRLPRPGETLLGDGFTGGPGGKGSNQAIAAKRLGGDVHFVGCVGKDGYGDAALELWNKEGVLTEHVKRSDSHTGMAFALVDRTGNNMIAVDPGANNDLGPEEVRRAEALFRQSGILLIQLEIPLETVETAARLAKACGNTIVLNPAPGRKASQLPLRYVDVVTPNEEEFLELAGIRDLKAGSEAILKMGPSTVVVTLGERGAFVATPDDWFTVPTPSVRAIDTTGAGDAFNGALAIALAEGKSLRQAVAFANLAGALTTTKKEVIPALPTRQELEDYRNDMGLE
jgi:ribokinase